MDLEDFVRGGSTYIFLFDEGRENQNTTISEPSLARHRNAIEMAFPWRADNGPKETLYFSGILDPLSSPLDPGMFAVRSVGN